MKSAIAALMLLGGVLTIQPDVVMPQNWFVVDKDGKRVQYVRKDPVIPGQYRIENREGETIGWVRPDPLFKSRLRRTDDDCDAE